MTLKTDDLTLPPTPTPHLLPPLVAGDHLLVAVQKQQGDVASETVFPQAKLVRVQPPTAKDYLVRLPSYFAEEHLAENPVFDSAGKVRVCV